MKELNFWTVVCFWVLVGSGAFAGLISHFASCEHTRHELRQAKKELFCFKRPTAHECLPTPPSCSKHQRVVYSCQ